MILPLLETGQWTESLDDPQIGPGSLDPPRHEIVHDSVPGDALGELPQ